MNNSQTDMGRRSHLGTRGVGNTIITAFAAAAFIKELPEIAEKASEKVKAVKERLSNSLNFSFIKGWTKEKILALAKGERPNPTEYLSADYIQQHLAKFEQEGTASRIVLKKDYETFGVGKPDIGKTEYVSTKSEIDEILKLPISQQSIKLGIPTEQLTGGEVLRIDFKLTNEYKAAMPTGNEWGTNSKWIPGGLLPDGNLEAVIKTEGMKEGIDYITNVIQ